MNKITQNQAPVNPSTSSRSAAHPQGWEVTYAPNGYALRPDGQMYTRAEIVSDPNYPALLPKFVDATNPPPYWRQMTGQELEAERKRIDAKNRRNKQARDRSAGKSSKGAMDLRVGWAVAGLVERANPVETFVAETTDPLAQDPDEVDGPRNLAESIMDLNGQDYKAARRSGGQRITKPSQAQAQAMLDKALKPGAGSGVQSHTWKFGR